MSRYIDADALYKKTAEWEAQALHMVKKTMNDEEPTELKKWSAILAERSAFKFDVADASTVDAVPVSYIYEKASELKNDGMIYAHKVLIGLIANYRADVERMRKRSS